MEHRKQRIACLFSMTIVSVVLLVFVYLGSARWCAKTSHRGGGRTSYRYDSMFKGRFFIPAAWLEANSTGNEVMIRVEIEHPLIIERPFNYLIEPFYRMTYKTSPFAGPRTR